MTSPGKREPRLEEEWLAQKEHLAWPNWLVAELLKARAALPTQEKLAEAARKIAPLIPIAKYGSTAEYEARFRNIEATVLQILTDTLGEK